MSNTYKRANFLSFQLPVANTRGVPHGPRIILGRPPPPPHAPPPPPPQLQQQQPQRPPHHAAPPKQSSATRPPQRQQRPVFTASPPQKHKQQSQPQQQQQLPIKLESITRPSAASSTSRSPGNVAALAAPADPTVGPQLKPAAAIEPDKIIFTSPPLDSDDDFRASDLAFTAPRVPSSPPAAAAVASEVVGNGLDHPRHHHGHRPRLHLPRDEDDAEDQLDSGSAPPGFRLRPRGHSAPMIISRVTDQMNEPSAASLAFLSLMQYLETSCAEDCPFMSLVALI